MGTPDLIIDLYCDVDDGMCSSILLIDMAPLIENRVDEDTCVLGKEALLERLRIPPAEVNLNYLFQNPTTERLSAMPKSTFLNSFPYELTQGMLTGTITEIIGKVREIERKQKAAELEKRLTTVTMASTPSALLKV